MLDYVLQFVDYLMENGLTIEASDVDPDAHVADVLRQVHDLLPEGDGPFVVSNDLGREFCNVLGRGIVQAAARDAHERRGKHLRGL
jgi:hypothetical protein